MSVFSQNQRLGHIKGKRCSRGRFLCYGRTLNVKLWELNAAVVCLCFLMFTSTAQEVICLIGGYNYIYNNGMIRCISVCFCVVYVGVCLWPWWSAGLWAAGLSSLVGRSLLLLRADPHCLRSAVNLIGSDRCLGNCTCDLNIREEENILSCIFHTCITPVGSTHSLISHTC